MRQRFGPFAPDLARSAGTGSDLIQNAVPTRDGYEPARTLSPVTDPLPGDCRGAAFALGGNAALFAGTASDLFRRTGNNAAFGNVSEIENGYSTGSEERWRFMRFGDLMLASNFSDPIQSFSLSGASQFEDLGGDPAPPRARYMAAVKNFVMLGYIVDGGGLQEFRVRWSAADNATGWPTPGSDDAIQVLSDQQDLFGDHGDVTGVFSGLPTCDAVIFQQQGLTQARFSPSSGFFFEFDLVEGARGSQSPDGIVQIGGLLYYLASDGFYITDGVQSLPIGADAVDRYFRDRSDQAALNLVQGGADLQRKLCYWSYQSRDSAVLDRTLVYNWDTKEWGEIVGYRIQAFTKLVQTAYTVEDWDSIATTLEDLNISIDDPSLAGGAEPVLSAVDASRQLGVFSGPSFIARLRTPEFEPAPEGRARVSQIRPLIGGRPVAMSGHLLTREDTFAEPAPQPARSVLRSGYIPARAVARRHQVELEIGAGEDWRAAAGCVLEVAPAGLRQPTPAIANVPQFFAWATHDGRIITDHSGRVIEVDEPLPTIPPPALPPAARGLRLPALQFHGTGGVNLAPEAAGGMSLPPLQFSGTGTASLQGAGGMAVPALQFSGTGEVAQEFAPTDIGSLEGWWDAGNVGSLTLTGDRVDGWADISGNGQDWQVGPEVSRPDYDSANDRIEFDHTSNIQYLLIDSGLPTLSAGTIMIVAEPTLVDTDFDSLISLATSTSLDVRGVLGTGSGALQARFDETDHLTFNSGDSPGVGDKFLLILKWDSTVGAGADIGEASLQVEGETIIDLSDTDRTDTMGPDYFVLGAHASANPPSGGGVNHFAHEVLLFSDRLTGTDLSDMISFLVDKHGLAP